MREDLTAEVIGRIVSRDGAVARGWVEFIPSKPVFRTGGRDYVPLGARMPLRDGTFRITLTLWRHTGVEYLLLGSAGRHLVRLDGQRNAANQFDLSDLIRRGRKLPAPPKRAHEAL